MSSYRITAFTAVCLCVGVGLADVSASSNAVAIAATYGSNSGVRSGQESAYDRPVPVIHSKWYVDRLTNELSRAAAEAARNKGFLLVQQLKREADMVNTQQPYSVYAAEARTVMSLGHWITATPGYGNLLLGARCYDIAYVCIGKMMVDMSCPATNIEPLVAMFDLSWYTPDVVAGVLNDEASMRLFGQKRRRATLADPKEVLQDIWSCGVEAGSSGIRSRLSVAEPYRSVTANERILLCSNLAFFATVLDGEPETTEQLWNKKRHDILINRIPREGRDIIGRTKEQLSDVLRFCQVVGGFPTNNPPREISDNIVQSLQFTFSRAWRKERGSTATNDNDTVIVATAWFYAMHMIDNLTDEDTLAEREWKTSE